ncbi:WD domain-containing protein, G-beta repeat-containing protein [Streptomyces sp. cf386]|uniref:CHAT domain-containing WD40 repeat protein n=1 Tax=Streptomyces sp. cf386 TaxID=1761904 RepID=UPI0008807F84|nr:CHAT domain-containing protein [Streptomyces sp. cf386]SDP74066.1 WD domain-containing protein, G-beta repeat-containing protein [Streptomyces sp. cf386]
MGEVREALDFNIALHAVGKAQMAHMKTTIGSCRVEKPLLTAQPRANALLERVAERVTLSTDLPGPATALVRELGTLMFHSVFDETARALLLRCRSQAQHDRRTLRISLNAHSGGLDRLPWEFLYDPVAGEHLAVDHALVRELDLPTTQGPLPVETPLRVLGMVARPSDLESLSVEQERSELHRSLRDLMRGGVVELAWVPGQSWRDLREALQRVRPHVLHFIGHGGLDPLTGNATLAFTDPGTGERHEMSAPDISPLMSGGTLRLVVLNACGTDYAPVTDPFSSPAASILRKGVPAVAAMQFPISDRAALEFSREFYTCLAQNDAVHVGVQKARLAMRTELKGSLEWGTPVLYLGSGIERIFDVHTPLATVSTKPTVQPRRSPGDCPGVCLERPSVPRLCLVQELEYRSAVHSISFSPGGEFCAVGPEGDSVQIVDVEKGRTVHTLHLGLLNHGPRTVRFSPDGTLFAAATKHRMLIWQTATGRKVAAVGFGRELVTGPRRLCFSSDSARIATAGWTGAAIWRAADGRILHRLPVHHTVTDLAFSPDDTHLVTADTEGRLLLWDTHGRYTPDRTFTHAEVPRAVTFSRPDGRHLVTAGTDQVACLWELPHGTPVRRIPHRSALNTVAVSPDGRLLATGGDDDKVCLWSLRSKRVNGRPRVGHHRDAVTEVAFSDDGRLLAAAAADGHVKIWRLEEEQQDD